MTSTHSRNAFTLVEIMVVVVIIGVLAAVAIPAMSRVKRNSVENTMVNDGRQIGQAYQRYFLENGVNSAPSDQIYGPDAYVKSLASGNRHLTTVLNLYTAGEIFAIENTGYGRIEFDQYGTVTAKLPGSVSN